MEMEIPILILIFKWIAPKKLSSPPQSAKLRDLQNQEYCITISKTRAQLTEKQE